MKQYDFSDKKLYNDMPPRKGMKIAPIVIQNRDIFINMGYSTKNMETFHSKVLVLCQDLRQLKYLFF